jgi:hypothetical protein
VPRPLAVDPVVGAHYGIGTGVDDSSEVWEVDLMERVLIDGYVDKEAGFFDAVECVMLHAGHHLLTNTPRGGSTQPAQ